MAIKTDNFKKIMSDPKQRNIYLATASVGVLAIVIGLFVATSGSKQAPTNNTAVPSVPSTVKSLPGTSNSEVYNQKVEESNKINAEDALKNDKTFVAPPVNDKVNASSPLDDLDKQRQKAKEEEQQKAEELKKPEVVEQPKEEPKVEQPAPPPPPPVVQAKPQKKWGSDDDYILLSTLANSWKARDSKSEFNYVGTTVSNQNTNGAANSQNAQQMSSTQQSNSKGMLIGKAGTIYHAVLETGINSDEPSPVLAKIVSGDLKGARIIGNMVTSGSKVVVEFNTMSVPSMSTSIKIKAVAVDPATARTGLASDVDNHYFLKYGLLLGATFLGGYADAVSQQNTQTNVSNGTVVVSRSNFDNQQLAMQGFGAVGKELANETRTRTQNLKPTITVNSGIAIGVLLMDDLYSGQ